MVSTVGWMGHNNNGECYGTSTRMVSPVGWIGHNDGECCGTDGTSTIMVSTVGWIGHNNNGECCVW